MKGLIYKLASLDVALLGFASFMLVLNFNLLSSIAYWGTEGDAYFYGLLTKPYLYFFKISSLDPHYPVQYPPYYFWLLGKFGQLTGIHSLSTLQVYSWIFSFSVAPIVVYYFLKNIFNSKVAFITALFFVAVLFFHDAATAVVQKPHEIWGIFGIFPLMIYVSNLHEDINKWTLFFAGIFYGFCFCAYTPIIFIPTLAAIVYGAALTIRHPILYKKFFNFYFILPAALLIFPYVISLLENIFLYGKSPTPTYFVRGDYSIHYVINGIIPFGVIESLAVIFTKDKQAPLIRWLAFCVIVSVCFYLGCCLLVINHSYFPAPFKYLILPCFISLILFSIRLEKAFVSRSAKIIIIVFLFLLGINFIYSPIYFLKAQPASSIANFVEMLRYNKLQKDILSLNQQFYHCALKPTYYLSSGQWAYMNYFVDYPLLNHLIGHETYAPAGVNLQARGSALNAAITKGTNSFYQYLKTNDIQFLFFQKNNTDAFNINFLYVDTQNKVTPYYIFLPKSYVTNLIAQHKYGVISESPNFLLLKSKDWSCT